MYTPSEYRCRRINPDGSWFTLTTGIEGRVEDTNGLMARDAAEAFVIGTRDHMGLESGDMLQVCVIEPSGREWLFDVTFEMVPSAKANPIDRSDVEIEL